MGTKDGAQAAQGPGCVCFAQGGNDIVSGRTIPNPDHQCLLIDDRSGKLESGQRVKEGEIVPGK